MNRRSTRPDPFLAALARTLERIDAKGHSVLLAVSGGADSVALMEGTCRLAESFRLRLEVASLDHGLRPEAAEEVAGVQMRAKGWGLPFHTRALNLAAGAGAEARARDGRYRVLEEIRGVRMLDFTWTAHTASDQAETVLMRLMRGSSVQGAASVLERRGTLQRPLLWATRSEVEGFLARLGVPFARDPMNDDRHYFRVRVRRDVLPALEAASDPGVTRRLAEFAKLAAAEDQLLDELTHEAWTRLSLRPRVLDAVGVACLALPLQRRVLARLLEEHGLEVSHDSVEQMREALALQGRCPLARRFVFATSGGEARCLGPGIAPRGKRPAGGAAQRGRMSR